MLIAAAAIAIGCRGCREPESPAPAAEALPALGLFDLAAVTDPAPEMLQEVIAADRLDDDSPELLDALELLPRGARPRVVGVQPIKGLDRTAVDLLVTLPGGGEAVYSVQTGLQEDGAWRVVWFAGPGVEWPARAAGRGQGLSTSAPPEEP